MKTVEVADDLPLDLKLLCLKVLEGDLSGAAPFIDCYLENSRGGERITVPYVELIEDTLHQFRTAAMRQPPSPEFAPAHSNYWRCVQLSRSLGRFGLS